LGAAYYNLGFNNDAIEEYKQATLSEYKILKELDIDLANELFDLINK